MSKIAKKDTAPLPTVERALKPLSVCDLNDLCDATDLAIKDGGGFGWLELPSREILERFWSGVIAMPTRILILARLDGVVCGACQLIRPATNNEAQSHSAQITTHFVAPWARGYGLASELVLEAEAIAKEGGANVINLDVRENQGAARKLYKSMDYVHFATHPAYAKVNGKLVAGHYFYKIL